LTKLIIGHGKAGKWSSDAHVIERDDKDLLEVAHRSGLFVSALKEGFATIDGELLGDGWLLLADVNDTDLNHDPSVITYCEAR